MNRPQKVGILSTIGLMGFAGFFDLAQFILLFIPIADVIADIFLGVAEIIIFALTFIILGVEIDPLTGIAVSVIEPIPFLGELPVLSVGVWNIIRKANNKYKKFQLQEAQTRAKQAS